MNLSVTFKNREGFSVVNMGGFYGGLALYERAVRELGLPELDPELVYNYVEGCFKDWVEIRLSLPEAKRVNAANPSLMWERGEVTVYCPRHGLNPYTEIVMVTRRNEQNGAIERISFRHQVTRDALLESWLAAGAPTEWSLTATDDNDTNDDE